MDDSSIPLGSMNRYLLLLLNDGDSALKLVRQPVGNGGPEDSSANDSYIPRFQRCQESHQVERCSVCYIRVMHYFPETDEALHSSELQVLRFYLSPRFQVAQGPGG